MKRVIACIDSSPCINALAEAAAWIAQKTNRELVLLQVLDYYPASYHLGEISGVIGFESNAMLLKELAELEQKQSELALDYSNNLLQHISTMIQQKYGIVPSHIQEKGDFLEQGFNVLREDDFVVIGRVGERSAEKNKSIGSNVENFIRGAKCTVLTVGENFKAPTRFIFAYEYSETCQKMLERVEKSDLLRQLQCHLVYVGDHPEILNEPAKRLKEAGLDVVVEYRYGDVAENILDYQNQHQIQLIVLGAFSHSKIHQFFLGSVTTTIFRNANVPLLVVK
ncbi:universal stress protein [Acinetobacter sichuanensis]|uniref:Universal stress protein n=1 Tax=Acinetobacter sichuanensis TaxID=2136183 RepID=A0A371YLG1_9GAMM|nr:MULTISPECIES: universal stress protein [Acinetobacter]MDM1247867.1 universal stress protein [Acinetobacter sp. R933-2]MDM1765207.1 universal stress protein [Acinetobacter sp. 226-1]MDM1768712.1 universal stress protein [Acinetobacter sp. 226-4]MDQ9022235.1 universal stress protein [Acinetobacter sichuanensis]RFC82329.1 universal stress protein [Acinetobacter sichuanensis]